MTLDLLDEVRLAMAVYAARGFPAMPDRALDLRARSANPVLEALRSPSMRLAIAEGARGVQYYHAARTISRDDMNASMTDLPRTEAEAATLRDVLDARVASAERRDPGNREVAWARESARRALADRERFDRLAAEQKAKDDEARFEAAVEAKLAERRG